MLIRIAAGAEIRNAHIDQLAVAMLIHKKPSRVRLPNRQNAVNVNRAESHSKNVAAIVPAYLPIFSKIFQGNLFNERSSAIRFGKVPSLTSRTSSMV